LQKINKKTFGIYAPAYTALTTKGNFIFVLQRCNHFFNLQKKIEGIRCTVNSEGIVSG